MIISIPEHAKSDPNQFIQWLCYQVTWMVYGSDQICPLCAVGIPMADGTRRMTHVEFHASLIFGDLE